MSENTENKEELMVQESQDGSATVEIPESMLPTEDFTDTSGSDQQKADGGSADSSDDEHPDDDEHLRQAKRDRRRAKKDLIRKTNQEKDARLIALQRENEEIRRMNSEMNRRLSQVEKNSQAEQITRIEKTIEDTQVSLEYAKMKLAEATQNQDGQAMVEAQTMWQNAQDKLRELSYMRNQAEQSARQQAKQPVNVPDPTVQRNAADWMRRNSWYNPQATDQDSRIAKHIDQLMVAQGWDPKDPDYWDELDSRLQKELPHRYNDVNDDDSRQVRRPRNVVTSSGREASAAYGGTNRTQFVLSPDRVKAMKESGAWDNPTRKKAQIDYFIKFDRENGRTN